MMRVFLLLIFLRISSIRTIEYTIDNQQICTHKPFQVNFLHNCSRSRLIPDVNVANNDQILSITIIFRTMSPTDASLIIKKSPEYNQTVYFTFFTLFGRDLSINNQTVITLNDITISSYLYQTGSGQIFQSINAVSIPLAYLLDNPYCLLKEPNLTLSSSLSRAYYLYTNETDLDLDLSVSTYQISPFFNGFNSSCFTTKSTLSALGIILIVIITVLSVAGIILVGICLRKQLKSLWMLFKNKLNQLRGLTPTVIIDD